MRTNPYIGKQRKRISQSAFEVKNNRTGGSNGLVGELLSIAAQV